MGSIDRALAACARLVLRFRKLVIAFGAAASLLSAYYAATHLGVNTSTANMISAKLQWRQDFNDYRDSFPALNNNIVVVVDAPSEADADAFSSALVERLEKRPDLYHSVFAARAEPFFQRNGLLYSSVGDLEKLDDRLTRAQPLLGLLRSGLDGAAVVKVVDKALSAEDANAAESAGMQPLAASLYAELAGAVGAAEQGQHNPIAWQRLMTGGTSNQTVARRTVLLQPVLQFDSMAPAAAAVKNLHGIIRSLTAKQFPGVKASLTGNIAMQHEEMLSVRRGANFAGIASFILATFLLYATLRSWKLLAISTVTLVAGLCGAGAFAAVAVGKLNLLSAAFAVTYIGLGTDYIIHVCLRVRELMAEGRGRDEAIAETIGGIGSSLVISAVTTAVGFYAFIPTAFSGVSELGIISGTGMFISVLASLIFLPALLGQFLGEADKNPRPAWLGTRGFKSLTARPAVVLLVTALIVAVSFGALPHVHFDSNPLHMRDPNSESVRALRELAADNQAALDDIDAVAPDHATALAWAAKLRRLNTVRSVTTVDSLVPDRQADKMAVLEDISLVMGPGFAQLERAAPNAADLEQALEGLERDLAKTSGVGGSAEHLEHALANLLGKLKTLSGPQREELLDGLDGDIVGGLPRELGQLATALRAEPFGLRDLPKPLLGRWISSDGREVVQVTPREDVSNNAAAERFVDSVRRAVPSATGLPVVYLEASRTVVHAFLLAFAYALVMITVLLWIFVRNVRDLLLVIVPILLATGATVGITVLFGIPLNFASIIGLPLLVGMNVDNSVHILHRVRTEPGKDGDAFGTSTSLAILSSNLTTIVSFGTLALSPHRGMASLGQMLTLGMILTLGASMVLLPALLKLKAFREPGFLGSQRAGFGETAQSDADA